MWNHLAQTNDRYAVRSVPHEQTDEEYEASGREDISNFLQNDSLLVELLPPFRQCTILEIGCGSGRLTKTLATMFQQIVAIDISSIMLMKAREFVSASNVRFVESDGTSVPVEPSSIDLAFSYIVYQHFPSKDSISSSFSNVARALRPGGLFKVQIRGLKHPDENHWSWGPDYTEWEARDLASSVGLTVLALQGVGRRSLWMLLQKT